MNIIIGGLKINTAKGELDASPLAHKSGILNLTLAENSANELIAGAFHAGLEKNDVNGAPDETFALNIDSQGGWRGRRIRAGAARVPARVWPSTGP